jgi:hypothetical protein
MLNNKDDFRELGILLDEAGYRDGDFVLAYGEAKNLLEQNARIQRATPYMPTVLPGSASA